MEIVVLVLLVLATSAVWVLNRWALRRGATPLGIGIVLTAVSLVGAIVGSVATRQPIYHPAAFFFGALGGIAYAAGFVLIILRCLATGPMGPAATVHSLGLAGTVVASLAVPYAPQASAIVCIGLGGTLVSTATLAFARTHHGAEGRSRLLIVGWGFAALCGAAQFLSGWFAPQAPFGYIVAQALVSLLILLIVASSSGGARPRLPDLVAGIGTAMVTAGLAPLSATVIGGMNIANIYPITVAAPVALVVLGSLMFRERLTVWGWTACALGIASLVLLSLPAL